jgi:predicted kinase
MDAARAAMGQGWPFAAGPWSNDETREPDAVGPDARGKTFWLLLGQLPKVTRRKGGTVIEDNTKAAYVRRLKQARRTGYLVDGYRYAQPILQIKSQLAARSGKSSQARTTHPTNQAIARGSVD